MNNRRGLTLVEVILTLAIIGIMAVTFLTIFNSSLLNIVRAGVRTDSVNRAELDLENAEIIEHKTVIVNWVDNKNTVKDIRVEGHMVKGVGVINQGLNTEMEVEIVVFEF